MIIITLLDELFNALISAEENFLNNQRNFHLEKSVKSSAEGFLAAFFGGRSSDKHK
jgi:hypothetical protein